MTATGSGMKGASSAELVGVEWLEDAPLTGTLVWWAEAHPLSAPTAIKLNSQTASVLPRN